MSRMTTPRRYRDVCGQLYTRQVLSAANYARKESYPPILITGPHGTGKSILSTIFSAGMLCAEEEYGACGECETCSAIFSHEHPDVLCLSLRDFTADMSTLSTFLALPREGYGVVRVEDVDLLDYHQARVLSRELLRLPPKCVAVLTGTRDVSEALQTVSLPLATVRLTQQEIEQYLTDAGYPEDRVSRAAAGAGGDMRRAYRLMVADKAAPYSDAVAAKQYLTAAVTGDTAGGHMIVSEWFAAGGTLPTLLGECAEVAAGAMSAETDFPLIGKMSGTQLRTLCELLWQADSKINSSFSDKAAAELLLVLIAEGFKDIRPKVRGQRKAILHEEGLTASDIESIIAGEN